MADRPNILFLMTDQMQGRVFEEGHPCQTPNFDRLAERGVRLRRAYTPNAVCSPARASLMTGLLPHNHGVLTVTHTVDDDQSCLRLEHAHWAQRLEAAGYRTGYFGKWHVERSEALHRFGWQVDGALGSRLWREKQRQIAGGNPPLPAFSLRRDNDQPPGYNRSILYGVTDAPPEKRNMGIVTALAQDFLDGALAGDAPWCCFASVQEPHDPFIAGADAFARYDVDAIELQPNVRDELEGRPNIYRKAARVWKDLTDREHREAAACYWAMVSEIDALYGRLIARVEAAGQLDNTLVVLASDHGELLGAHGLYCKNFTAAEEVYNIPMLISGPGCARDVLTDARVGLHDLGPTLLELAGCESIEAPDSRSCAGLLVDPKATEADFDTGFAEYHGGRMVLTQRVVWDGSWKFVFNGFDFDELYNLDEDPFEMCNLAEDPAHRERLEQMTKRMWQVVRDTGDRSLFNSHYPILRVAAVGPLVLEEETNGR